ncbi:extracellular solute-binding protein [Chloroflexota bacterium]
MKKEKWSINNQSVYLMAFALLLLTSCSRIIAEDIPTLTQAPTSTVPGIKVPTPTLTPTEVIIQGTITIWHSFNETEMPALEMIINDFSALYPNVYFDVLYVPLENLQTRFEIEAQDGRGPTILLGPANWGPTLYDAGLITALTDLNDNDVLETLNQPALGAARYKNELIGLPYSIKGVVLFRNKNILPDSAATFDNLIYNANTATQGEVLGAMLERSFIFSGAHLEGIGGRLMESNGFPAFNNIKGVEWLDLLIAFEETGPSDYISDQDVELFKEGKVGLIIDGTWNMSALANAIGAQNLAIDHWPEYGDGSLSGYVLPENLYLNSQISGDRLTASKMFMEYLVAEKAQSIFAETGSIPAATNIIMTDPITGTLMTKAMSALAIGSSYPIAPEMEAYQIPMDMALRSVFSGATAPLDALLTAEESIIQALSEPGITPTPTP